MARVLWPKRSFTVIRSAPAMISWGQDQFITRPFWICSHSFMTRNKDGLLCAYQRATSGQCTGYALHCFVQF